MIFDVCRSRFRLPTDLLPIFEGFFLLSERSFLRLLKSLTCQLEMTSQFDVHFKPISCSKRGNMSWKIEDFERSLYWYDLFLSIILSSLKSFHNSMESEKIIEKYVFNFSLREFNDYIHSVSCLKMMSHWTWYF